MGKVSFGFSVSGVGGCGRVVGKRGAGGMGS